MQAMNMLTFQTHVFISQNNHYFGMFASVAHASCV